MATSLFLSWAYWETEDAEVWYGRHSTSRTRHGPWGPPCEKFGWGECALTGNSRISIFHPSRLHHSPQRGPYRLNFCQAIGQHQNQSRMPSRPGPVKIAVCEGNARVLDRMPRFAQSQNTNAQHHAGGSACRGFGGALEYRCPKPGLRGKNRAPEQKPVMRNLFRNHFLRAHAQFDAETGPRNKTRARGTPAACVKPGTARAAQAPSRVQAPPHCRRTRRGQPNDGGCGNALPKLQKNGTGPAQSPGSGCGSAGFDLLIKGVR